MLEIKTELEQLEQVEAFLERKPTAEPDAHWNRERDR
jgi:hypothetical protein